MKRKGSVRTREWVTIGGVLAVALACSRVAMGRTIIVYPLNASTVREVGGTLVGYCDEPDTYEVEVDANGKKRKIELWDGIFDVDLKWQPGENKIAVRDASVKFQHDPWAAEDASASGHQAAYDNCGNCHLLGEARSLKLKDSPEKLCRTCHEPDSEGFEHRNIEIPCTLCHVEHAALRPHLLRTTAATFCLPCHKDLKLAESTPHEPPLENLQCLECHLRPILNGACHSCHPQKTGNKGSVHGSAADRKPCVGCHVPHQTGSKELVRVCTGCHGRMESADPGHAATIADRCDACHSMHDGPPARKTPATACGACHGASTPRSCSGRQGACTDCHTIHGSPDTPASPPPPQ
jgi:predicted CXXCH cytochrome family protein